MNGNDGSALRRGGSARGRPRIGSGTGAVVVPVSLERTLLERADAYAKQAGLKRSTLVSRALESLLEKGDAGAGKARTATPKKRTGPESSG